MNVSEFVSKWRKVELTKRSASQQHFLDLCEVFEHPKPAQADPTGETFTFEKGAAKHGGLPHKCATLDRQIDNLVYELYDLTPEEIAIVEGETK